MADPLLDFAERVLGSRVDVVAERGWTHGKSRVIELQDAAGSHWFAKHHGDIAFYRTEREAYQRWVPAFGQRAPSLRGHDDALAALLVSGIPAAGTTDWRSEDVRRDGGVALRLLHGAEAFGPWADIAEEKRAELDTWLRRGDGLFDRNEHSIAESCVRALASLPAPDRVPCHCDYTPRNWVVADGRVHVIDFEEARPDAWVTDLGRMALGWWRNEPHMMDAIFDGYGRQPDDDDIAIMRCTYVATAVRLIVLASELGSAEFVAATRVSLQDVARLLA